MGFRASPLNHVLGPVYRPHRVTQLGQRDSVATRPGAQIEQLVDVSVSVPLEDGFDECDLGAVILL